VAKSPKAHHLDKRAARLLAAGAGDDDELLNTRATADWLGVSTQWLEIGRCKSYGPPFIRLSPHAIGYRRGDVRLWLKARTYTSTKDYATAAGDNGVLE